MPENAGVSLFCKKQGINQHLGVDSQLLKTDFFPLFFFEFFLKSMKFQHFPAFLINFDQRSGVQNPNAGQSIQQWVKPSRIPLQDFIL